MATALIDSLKSQISLALNRGTVYDSQRDQALRDAVNWLEENYTFKYMQLVDESKTLTEGTRDVTLGQRPKTMLSIKFRNDEGVWVPKGEHGLPRIEPWQVLAVESGFPNGYFYASRQVLRFDNTADQDYPLQIVGEFYSNSQDLQDENLPILSDHPALLKAAAILQLNLRIRSERLEAFWSNQLQLSLHSALGADAELRYTGRNVVMNPYPGFDATEES